MELLLPSLVILIIAGFFVFFVIPRVSPTIIFIISLIFLFIMVQAHYGMFKNEYKLNTWREQLAVLAQPILISIIVLGILFASSQFLFGIDVKGFLGKFKEGMSFSKYRNIPASKREELENEL